MPQSISQSSVISADTVWGRACASTGAQSYETNSWYGVIGILTKAFSISTCTKGKLPLDVTV